MGRLNEAEAEIVIDAKGLAAAPGFIDAHSHSDMSLILFADEDGKIIQGVTTEVAGICGNSLFPLTKFMAREKGLASDMAIVILF